MDMTVGFKKEFETVQKALAEISIMPLSEFVEYAPLFSRQAGYEEMLTEEERKDLSAKYFARINIYDELKVVDDHDRSKVLFTLPKIFTSVKSIIFEEQIQKPLGMLMKPFTMPKHRADAMKRILDLMLSSQSKDRATYAQEIRKGAARYKELAMKITEIGTDIVDDDVVDYSDQDSPAEEFSRFSEEQGDDSKPFFAEVDDE